MTTRLGFLGALVAALCCGACGSSESSDGDSSVPVLGPCSADKPFCQKFQGRSWTEMKEDLTFDAAKEYCSSLGGRLPTISELRTLIVECPETMPGGTCRLTDTCSSSTTCWDAEACNGCGDGGQSAFGDDPPFWSSTPFGNETMFGTAAIEPGSMWTIAFRYNDISPCRPTYPISAYCLKP